MSWFNNFNDEFYDAACVIDKRDKNYNLVTKYIACRPNIYDFLSEADVKWLTYCSNNFMSSYHIEAYVFASVIFGDDYLNISAFRNDISYENYKCLKLYVQACDKVLRKIKMNSTIDDSKINYLKSKYGL